MLKCIRFYCLLLLSLFVQEAYATIKFINKVCVDDVAGFIYIPTNGKTVSSIYWEFGDGFTSNTTNSIHVYTKKGTYSVNGVVTFTDATTLTESVTIEILGLPNANFINYNFTDSCTYNNQLCLKDLSTPDNAGQPITRKIITWGDGNTYNTSSPYNGEISCNSYFKADKFKVVVEITDNAGCKNTFRQYVTIREGINVSLRANVEYTDCKTAKLCLENVSYHGNKLTPKYEWKIDSLPVDTNSYLKSAKCLLYKATKSFSVSLTGTLPNGCTETSTRNFNINLDAITKDIKLSDTVICYGSGERVIHASVNVTGLTDIRWSLDNKAMSDHSSTIDLKTDDSLMLPGYHYLTCEFIRGNCSTSITRVVHVRGPVASFEVFNFNGCIIPEKRIFFINQSTYDPKYTTFNWTVEDVFGDNCITDRSKKNNKSDYCNMAVDSFAIHRFRQTVDESLVTFRITDIKTGCYDEVEKLIINKCCRLCQGGPVKDIEICLGDLIFEEEADVKLPHLITFDNGNKWYRYPVTSDSVGVGTYDMQIIFRNEYKRWLELFPNDSFQIRSGHKVLYDTLSVLNKLIIHDNRKDSITVKVYGTCSPFRASLIFRNTLFRKGEEITIDWGDGKSTTLTMTSDMVMDSFTHQYTIPGLEYLVKASVTNPANCKSSASAFIEFGKIMDININNFICAGNTGCFTPMIKNTRNNKFWNDSSNRKQVVWWSDQSKHKDTSFTHCEYFPDAGQFKVYLHINDSDGCSENFERTIKVNGIKAGIKNHMRDVYCTELTQFFDSSVLLGGDPTDFIVSYQWDFGANDFTITDKDPSKAFDLPGDSLRITHVVTTNKGCTDTVRSALKFIGANTYFTIKDTLACGHLDGVFYNKSVNCSKFIWEFGNDSNSTFNTDITETAYKTYRKVGKYKIRLRGIRSVYNPFTQNMYFCSSIFPDPDYDKDSSRTVWVLPEYKAAILSRDTICVHDSIAFTSNIGSVFKSNTWAIDDSAFTVAGTHSGFTRRFDTEGLFKIRLMPQIPNNNSFLSCVDSAEKKVLVVKVRAGFTINDNYVPNIQFNNISTPKFAKYVWNFGDVSSNSNSSSAENPNHTYMDLSKEYTICLIASLEYGCADTVCKPVGPYTNYCSMYNVFTPGSVDGFNDLYDVVIEGEASYDLVIYDRWGVMVYKSDKDNDDSQNNNWNGRLHNKGAECSAGTYYYLFNYTMKAKPEEKKMVNGVITLIR